MLVDQYECICQRKRRLENCSFSQLPHPTAELYSEMVYEVITFERLKPGKEAAVCNRYP
ncbi:MAG: hypothetical protein K0Q73_1003 [Paenibacillus sp.]|jgi:hypothetical protein|nr:hypothetical protein [Paenibacillus sp.]